MPYFANLKKSNQKSISILAVFFTKTAKTMKLKKQNSKKAKKSKTKINFKLVNFCSTKNNLVLLKLCFSFFIVILNGLKINKRTKKLYP